VIYGQFSALLSQRLSTPDSAQCGEGSSRDRQHQPQARLMLPMLAARPMLPGAPAICHAAGMTVQIAVKLDDGLAEQLKAAAADAGTNLSEWIRAALQHQALVAKAMRARAEEDTRGPRYTQAEEVALMASRRRRAIAALDEQ
jgi:Ribbon-helix-helix protein, copG family